MMSKPISPAGPSHPPNLSPILSSNEAPPIIPLPTLLNWHKQPLPPQVILDRFLKAAPHSAQQAITLTTSWFNNLLETIGGHKGPLVDLMANRLGLGTGRTTELGRRIMAAVVFSPAFAPGLQALSDLQPDAAQVWTDNLPKLSQAFLQYLDVRVPRSHIFLPLWEVPSVFGSIADMAAATGRRTRASSQDPAAAGGARSTRARDLAAAEDFPPLPSSTPGPHEAAINNAPPTMIPRRKLGNPPAGSGSAPGQPPPAAAHSQVFFPTSGAPSSNPQWGESFPGSFTSSDQQLQMWAGTLQGQLSQIMHQLHQLPLGGGAGGLQGPPTNPASRPHPSAHFPTAIPLAHPGEASDPEDWPAEPSHSPVWEGPLEPHDVSGLNLTDIEFYWDALAAASDPTRHRIYSRWRSMWAPAGTPTTYLEPFLLDLLELLAENTPMHILATRVVARLEATRYFQNGHTSRAQAALHLAVGAPLSESPLDKAVRLGARLYQPAQAEPKPARRRGRPDRNTRQQQRRQNSPVPCGSPSAGATGPTAAVPGASRGSRRVQH